MNHYGSIVHQTITEAEVFCLERAMALHRTSGEIIATQTRLQPLDTVVGAARRYFDFCMEHVACAAALRNFLITLPDDLTLDVVPVDKVNAVGDAIRRQDSPALLTAVAVLVGASAPPHQLPAAPEATPPAAKAEESTEQPFDTALAEADGADPLSPGPK